MKKIFFLLLISSFAYAFFDYECAILQAQKNNWPAAQELLTNVIVENPERPDALYDLGVASYKNNKFDAALSYFNKAAGNKDASSALQQQANFNAGNAHVQLKQLHEAIDVYDRVLAQKPDHQQALHNKEVVKKMLEQQKQESADNKSMADKDKEKENPKDQNTQQQNKDDKNQKDPEDKQQKDKQDSKNQDQQNKKDQDKNKDQNKSDPSSADKSNEQSADAKAMADKKDESGTEQKKQSGEQQKDNKQKQEENAASAQADQKSGQEKPEQQLSAGLARALEDREKKDAQLNKKLTKALVANQGGSKNDYNCW